MDSKQAERVKIGDRIKWHGIDDDSEVSYGSVIETGFNAFKVEYEDGQIDTYKFREPHRLVSISVVS